MNRHIIHQYATIIEALRRLNELSGDVMTLIVTDESNRMLGTVTDGTFAADCSTVSPRPTSSTALSTPVSWQSTQAKSL